MLTRFRQASSKVSPGSARTSRSRKSKASIHFPPLPPIQPFQRTTPHREASSSDTVRLPSQAGAHFSKSCLCQPHRPYTIDSGLTGSAYPQNSAQAQQDMKNHGIEQGPKTERERRVENEQNMHTKAREGERERKRRTATGET